MIAPLATAATGFEASRDQATARSAAQPLPATAGTQASARSGGAAATAGAASGRATTQGNSSASAFGIAETPEDRRETERLRATDRKVRAHELAHSAAGGGVVTGAASYEYVRGPDGKLYAVGGEVPIDVSPERTPEATLAKAEAIRRAALAPADPSSTDRQVAAQAAAMAAEARARIAALAASQDASPVGAAAGAAYRRNQESSGLPDLGGFIDQRA